jgi:hypothetical protein
VLMSKVVTSESLLEPRVGDQYIDFSPMPYQCNASALQRVEDLALLEILEEKSGEDLAHLKEAL